MPISGSIGRYGDAQTGVAYSSMVMVSLEACWVVVHKICMATTSNNPGTLVIFDNSLNNSIQDPDLLFSLFCSETMTIFGGSVAVDAGHDKGEKMIETPLESPAPLLVSS